MQYPRTSNLSCSVSWQPPPSGRPPPRPRCPGWRPPAPRARTAPWPRLSRHQNTCDGCQASGICKVTLTLHFHTVCSCVTLAAWWVCAWRHDGAGDCMAAWLHWPPPDYTAPPPAPSITWEPESRRHTLHITHTHLCVTWPHTQQYCFYVDNHWWRIKMLLLKIDMYFASETS